MSTASLRTLSIALGLSLAACGGPAEEEPVGGDTTAGAEVVEPELPTGPVRSHVSEGDAIVMRLDMGRVRSSAVSADIASLVRSYPAWQQLLGSSGIDPVRDFERVLISTPAGGSSESARMVIAHRLTTERVREAVLAVAVDRSRAPAWRTVRGFDVVDWPAPSTPPRIVVISGPRELIVTSAADLDAALEIAHDHRLRREGDAVVEPALAFEPGVIATLVATEMSDRIRARFEHPPERFELVLRDEAAEGAEAQMAIAARGIYADATAADAARAWVVQQRDFYAGQMLVRAVGLDRALRRAEIVAEGEVLRLDARFTEEEVQRVLGLLAFAQMGGG